jgi:hypothetical protein
MYTNDDHWRRPGSCIIYDDSQRQCEVGGRVLQPFTSSRLSSPNIDYGLTSIQFKLPVGSYLWPALWMLPAGWSVDKSVNWPECGEIDLMESMGNPRQHGFSFFNDSEGSRDGAALHIGTCKFGCLNFFSFLWTHSMVDACVPGFSCFEEAYQCRSSSSALGSDEYLRQCLLRDESNLRILAYDTVRSKKAPMVKLDVDLIFRGMAKQALSDPVRFGAFCERTLEERVFVDIFGKPRSDVAELKRMWKEDSYHKNDVRAMQELLEEYGYTAGLHMDKKQWTKKLGYRGGVVSSYALYLIAIAKSPPRVISLYEFMTRTESTHAAPFDVPFRLQVNVAVGGRFFSGGMNTMNHAEHKVALPYGHDIFVAGTDAHQFLQNINRDDESNWLKSWLQRPEDVMHARYVEYTLRTPTLADHTKFILKSVTHTARVDNAPPEGEEYP